MTTRTPYGAPGYVAELEATADRIAGSGADFTARLVALARLAARWPDDAVALGWLMWRTERVAGMRLKWSEARRLLRAARSRHHGAAA